MIFNLIILRKGNKNDKLEMRKKRKEKKIKKGMHHCIPLHKIIDSISANNKNHNCQCFIYETNYLS